MELWIGALNLGFLYAFMAMGVYITFRVHDFPDITVDGSFTTGAAVAAVLLIAGVHPLPALLAAFALSALAGSATALIHVRYQIHGLLAGILVMTGLYSINLHIMGRSNIPLLNQRTLFSLVDGINPGLHPEIWTALVLVPVMILFWLGVSFFFRTDLGLALRATGNNQTMAAAEGIPVNRMKIGGVALANGLVGFSGALVAQYQGFADIGMGIGTVVVGLASVIIGESVLRRRSIFVAVGSVIIGSVIFRMMIALALLAGMNPIDLKLLTAGFVLVTLVVSQKLRGSDRPPAFRRRLAGLVPGKRAVFTVVGAVALVSILALAAWEFLKPSPRPAGKRVRISVVQVSDTPVLDFTRLGLVSELERLGYVPGRTCLLDLANAQGDLSTVSTILDRFVQDGADVVVTISTACTQTAIRKIKDRPIVFATVANPFIIEAGKSDTEHLSNVTGTYGWVPMDRCMELACRLVRGPLKVGAMWDPAQANSVFNVENLQSAVAKTPGATFLGQTITNSSEVQQAAQSLVQRGINVFVLSTDNVVFSAFDSVVKAAAARRVPIFASDVELVPKGALCGVGYDYTTSGIQAARLVDRVLKGENPARIPFERHRELVISFNLPVAESLGVPIPPDVRAMATHLYEGPAGKAQEKGRLSARIGVIQFALEPCVEICKKGLFQALADKGYVEGKNLEVVTVNAQADFAMIRSGIQDLIRRDVSVIVPLSTPCLQAAVQCVSATGKPKIVFTYVNDPFRVGAGRSPTDHLPFVTGVSCLPPMDKMLALIREMYPRRRVVGVIWNSSESNSEAAVLKLRELAPKAGFQLLEATITNPAEVMDAARSLVNRGAKVFLNSGDNTLNVAFDSFAKVAEASRIPLFSNDSETIDQGALVAQGPDFYQTGYEGGEVLARVLGGEDPAGIPIRHTEKLLLLVNLEEAGKIGLSINPAILKRADRVRRGP